MSPEIADRIAALGRVIDPVGTAAIYAPLHDQEPYASVRLTRDIAYGPADRQRLDVFEAEGAAGARPVLIFVHGGGFIGGNKHTPGSPFYDNVPLWAARNGLVGVNMTYPLAPEAAWPTAAENIASAVTWVADNIAQHGGDPTRVFLFGHSAGATHVASYLAHRQFHGPRGSLLSGAILMSGVYDLTSFPPAQNWQSYFGTDPARYAERSTLAGLTQQPVPLMVAAAELEPQPFLTQYQKLADALGGKARAILLSEHSHLSEGFAIGTDDTALTGQILSFFSSLK